VLQQPITEDPDVADAVATFRPVVMDIRVRSAAMFALPAESADRAAVADVVTDLVAGMALRAERLGITLDDLFRLVNWDLAARPPAQGHAHAPTGAYLRELLDENTRAHAAEGRAHKELTAAQGRLRVATAERLAADRACAGWTAGWALRGDRR
jgi:hypothetical protein